MQSQLAAQPAMVASSAAAFRNNVRSMGNMSLETMRVASAAENYTKALAKQDVTLRQAIRNRQTFNQVLREQYNLSRAATMQWSTGNRGMSTVDLIVPRDAPARLGNFRETLSQVRAGTISTRVAMGEMAMTMGLVSQVAMSGANNMIKWGKNTQWAGRQLMVGFTMPVIAAGAAMGVLAYKVESEMTRINKVYDFTANKDTDAAKASQEAAQLRINSFAGARLAAQQYGAKMEDTLKVEANLAATGEKGAELIGKTTEVMRLATLGEMEYQNALDTTITLQSVYGQNTSQLAESFNYMNAVENATVLSIEDFSKAIPKVAAPLKTLGGDIKDVGTLLVAMRVRGINAVEGANAIKASFNRVLNPTKAAKTMFEQLTNQSLVELVRTTQGDVIPTFLALNKATKNLTGLEKQQLFGKLFGTQQTTRLQAIVEEMSNLEDNTTDVGKAYEIAGQEAGQWATAADREMKALQQSASGKFKIAIESLKVELAEAGKPFLTAGAMIVGVIMNIIKWFNELPEGIKTFASLGIIALAIAGPIVMLVGLFANLGGQALKLGAGVLGLVFRFRALLPEQVAARLAALQTNAAMNTQIGTTRTLTMALSELTATMNRAAAAQAGMQGFRFGPTIPQGMTAGPAAPPLTNPYTQLANGRWQGPGGRFVSAAEVRAFQAASQSAQNIQTSAAATQRSFNMMGGAFQGILLSGGIMGSMATDSGTMANNLANAAVAAGLIATVLAGPLTKFASSLGTMMAPAFAAIGRQGSAAFSRISGAGTTAMTRVGGAASSAVAALGGMGAIMGTVLAVAIAIGAAWYIINKNIKASREEQAKIADSAKAWSETLGFAYQETQGIVAAGGKNVDSMNDKMNKFRENNKAAYEDLQKFFDDDVVEKWSRALEEGTKVRLRGGTKAAAEEAVRVSLAIMGKEYSDADFAVKIKAEMNFDDIKDVIQQRLDDAAQDMKDATNKNFSQSGGESFARFFANNSTIQQRAGEQIRKNAKDLWDIYDNTSEKEKKRVFEKIASSINEESVVVFEKYKAKYSEEFAKNGVETYEQFLDFIGKKESSQKIKMKLDLGLSDKEIDQVLRSMGAVREFNQEFGKFQGIPEEKTKDMFNVNELKGFITALQGVEAPYLAVEDAQKRYNDALKSMAANGLPVTEQQKLQTLNYYRLEAGLHAVDDASLGFSQTTMTVANAQKAYADALKKVAANGLPVTETQKLAILNLYREKAGLDAAKNSQEAFTGATRGNTGALLDNLDAIEANTDNIQEFVNARKSAMSGTMNDVYSRAEEIMNDQQNAEVDAINRRSEARSKALDRAQEAMDKRFDDRQEATEKRFEAKQEALDKEYEMKNRAFDARWDSILEGHEKKWELRVETENAAYDAKIKNIKDAIQAEEDAEKKRQEIFEREKTRIQRAAQMANMRIDFNMAINSGNLDEAAKIGNNMQANLDSWATEDTAASSQSASDKKITDMNNKITSIEAERDRRMKVLQEMEEAEKKQLEARKQREQDALNAQRDAAFKSLALAREKAMKQIQIEREAYNKGVQAQREALAQETKDKIDAVNRKYQAAKRALEDELAALKAFVPRNQAELDEHIKKVEAAYGRHGVNLMAAGNEWAKFVGGALQRNVDAAAEGLKSNIAWDQIGKSVAAEITKGAFGLTIQQFSKWVSTGELPASGLNESTGKNKQLPRHKGGLIDGSGGSRAGYAPGSGRAHSEVDVLARRGEYMINDKAVRKYGTDFMDNLNAGQFGTGGLGANESMGLAGLMGANMAAMMQSIIQEGIQTGANQAMMFGIDGTGIPGMAGMYGNVSLNASQLSNAAAIIAVGKSMGATNTDLIVSIMTAMQESTLNNIRWGDRDSIGLFQQRPSQGWGTIDQIMNPQYAARKFFEGLLAMKNRAKLPLWEQAQRVQRSGFPMAYAKWEAMARAVVAGTGFKPNNLRGWNRPVSGIVTNEWNSRHGGIDIGVGTGTPVRAANAGTVVTSQDIPGFMNGGYSSYGRYIVIDHGGMSTLYAHLSDRYAREGQRVGTGTVIGLSGNTGNSTGPHLHFETRGPGGFPGFNPRSLIPGLQVGGKILYDNTIANLHKNETVLTAPLSQKLERGIERIDSGVANTYNVNMTIEGPINSQIDFERGVKKALETMESNRGRSRVTK